MIRHDTAGRGAGGAAASAPTQAVTNVIPQAPVPAFDPWSAIGWVIGGIIALVVLINAITEIVDRFLAWQKDSEQEDAGELSKVAERIKDLEVNCREFMPRGDVKAAFEHASENRRMADRAATERFGRHEDRLSAVEREQTRLGTEMKGQSATLARIERSVETMATRFDDKLDRIAVSVGKMPSRAE